VIRLSDRDFFRGIASLGKGVITGGVVGELSQQEGGIGGQFDPGWKMAGGKQNRLSQIDRHGAGHPVEMGLALWESQQTEAAFGLKGDRARAMPTEPLEVLAPDQPLAGGLWQRFWASKLHRRSFEVDDFQCLVDMKWSGVAMAVDSIPIVEAKGAVAGLLDLHHQKS